MLYAFYDFQSDPDTLPLLPYGAIGVGGAGRRVDLLRADATVCGAVSRPRSWSWDRRGDALRSCGTSYVDKWGNDHKLLVQLRGGVRARSRRRPGMDQLVSLGNPEVFVLTKRRSPTNYIYLSSGVDKWKIKHTKGGLKAWVHEIIAEHPAVINVDGWQTAWTKAMTRFLREQRVQASATSGATGSSSRRPAIARAKKAERRSWPRKRQHYARATDGKRLPAKVPCGNG